jgi:uncharacterized zinc-type alcohol dehydrogenase-like protein
MPQIKAIAAMTAGAPLEPFSINRRELRPSDVRIDITHCGICHSDIHQARNEWGGGVYPMVPGHEILGRISAVGSGVRRLKKGMLAGVGCIVDSCRSCHACTAHEEQYCVGGMVGTYNGRDKQSQELTYGGYSSHIVVDENYVLTVSEDLPVEGVAPLLCAGITTYSPLMRYAVKPKSRVGVMGLGGLGHMAVKLAAAMGHEVCMLSTSKSKEADAKRLGAHSFALTQEKDSAKRLAKRFDVVINTVSAPHDLNAAVGYLDTHGTMVMLGAPPEGSNLKSMGLLGSGRQLAGSLIGGIKETQDMLDFCAKHSITSEVEMCTAQQINMAYDRMLKNDVKYRFVVDMASL